MPSHHNSSSSLSSALTTPDQKHGIAPVDDLIMLCPLWLLSKVADDQTCNYLSKASHYIHKCHSVSYGDGWRQLNAK